MTALPQIMGVHSASQSYAGLVLSMNPLGFWPLDEANGTTARDTSGNGFDGTYVSSPTLHDKQLRPPNQYGVSRATDFRTNDYVDLDTHIASFGNQAAFSVVVQFVMLGSNANFDMVVSLSDNTQATDLWVISIDAERALFWVADGGNKIFARTVGALTQDVPNILAVGADGSGNDAFVNGVAIPYVTGDSNTAGGTDQVANLDRMRIANVNRAGNENRNFWDGPIWNVACFDSRLSISQLNALYLASLYGT